ncbi:RING-H2 finger protein [Quillaja saponaria]|uniref:RING-H2 finger protein n=1 Tax=Quillaja saponaria TaxID=32244 RepID=A0AAD7M1V7_QUISA|nr:RING-H2 finger protein [Quillaja saponaria]
MTSASELFHSRRHRLGRTTDDLGLDSLPDRNLHVSSSNRRHHHHSRHDVDGGDGFRRSSHPRQHCHRASHAEHGSMRFDQGTTLSLSSNSVNAENLNSRNNQRVTGNDRLPGAVILARARLVERLRGASPSGNRDWVAEIPIGNLARGALFTDLTSMGRAQLLQEQHKKPPGLSQEALDSLHLEVFNGRETELEGMRPRVPQDCSICLESFMEGDKLTCLPCGHKFHFVCLDPWVRCCGDCPYCRRDIIIPSDKP